MTLPIGCRACSYDKEKLSQSFETEAGTYTVQVVRWHEQASCRVDDVHDGLRVRVAGGDSVWIADMLELDCDGEHAVSFDPSGARFALFCTPSGAAAPSKRGLVYLTKNAMVRVELAAERTEGMTVDWPSVPGLVEAAPRIYSTYGKHGHLSKKKLLAALKTDRSADGYADVLVAVGLSKGAARDDYDPQPCPNGTDNADTWAHEVAALAPPQRERIEAGLRRAVAEPNLHWAALDRVICHLDISDPKLTDELLARARERASNFLAVATEAGTKSPNDFGLAVLLRVLARTRPAEVAEIACSIAPISPPNTTQRSAVAAAIALAKTPCPGFVESAGPLPTSCSGSEYCQSEGESSARRLCTKEELDAAVGEELARPLREIRLALPAGPSLLAQQSRVTLAALLAQGEQRQCLFMVDDAAKTIRVRPTPKE